MTSDACIPEGDDPPIVDWAVARKNIPGGPAGVVELAGMMQEECARLTEEIRRGLEDRNASRVRLAAHTLRGGVLHFGSGPVVEAATAVQAFAAAGELDAAGRVWPALEALVAKLVEELGRADRHAGGDAR